MAEWRRAGAAVPGVSVNLSPLSFRRPDLPDFIAALLRKHDLPGESLTLEITESAAMALTPEMLAQIHIIRALGVGLSVDDFGIGFSNLANLANLPVTEIKIDRSFINQCLDERRMRSLVETIINIGLSLELTVVAEGVETDEQRQLLAARGCPVLQGYLFSRPLDAPQAAAWLKTRRPHARGVRPGGEKSLPAALLDYLGELGNALPYIGISFATLPDAVIQYSNAAFNRLAGCRPGYFRTAEQFLQETYIHARQRELVRKNWSYFQLWPTPHRVSVVPEMELEIMGVDGELRSLIHFGVILHERRLAVALFKDVTPMKREHQALWELSYLDALTGLFNRRGLSERWKEEVERGRSLAFLMVDLDGFKRINDTYGHDIGDLALRVAATRLRAAVGESDLVCRLGGDEFGVLLAAPERVARLEDVCRRIAAELDEPIAIGDMTFHISASIGGSRYPEQAADLRELLQNADQAMYRVKKNGKGG